METMSKDNFLNLLQKAKFIGDADIKYTFHNNTVSIGGSMVCQYQLYKEGEVFYLKTDLKPNDLLITIQSLRPLTIVLTEKDVNRYFTTLQEEYNY